jgi:undecaprenyl-phosphate galactose phosphotransferase
MNTGSVVISGSLEKNFDLKRVVYVSTKRLFDILVGLVGIIATLFLAVIIKIIYICSGDFDPIFFEQKRIGKDGQLFMIYKFRTMVPKADEVLVELMRKDASFRNEYLVNKKVKNDPRVTKVGKFLRQSSLDEFPQFINVFLGQMSLVGNRPYLPREVEDMGEYYKYIIASKPGITGLWQTSGRSNTSFYERLVIEKKYSKIQGFRLDIKIIFKTMIQVIKKDGAN